MYIDEFGVLHRGSDWVALPPIEERLAAALFARAGYVVSRRMLARAGWPDGPPKERSIDSRILQLRRRVAPLGVCIQTVRGQGFLLELTR